MYVQAGVIEQGGRITLPRQILDALGIQPSRETEVIVELTEAGVVIKPRLSAHPITDRLASMSLPVADWDQMEQDIEAGRVGQ
jgi:bifunctional DNA-binding transcriptional regulator/antitoxin component of YhaV-PrlF toxin-antitoxin module